MMTNDDVQSLGKPNETHTPSRGAPATTAPQRQESLILHKEQKHNELSKRNRTGDAPCVLAPS